MKNWYSKNVQEVLQEVGGDLQKGLSSEEVVKSREQYRPQ